MQYFGLLKYSVVILVSCVMQVPILVSYWLYKKSDISAFIVLNFRYCFKCRLPRSTPRLADVSGLNFEFEKNSSVVAAAPLAAHRVNTRERTRNWFDPSVHSCFSLKTFHQICDSVAALWVKKGCNSLQVETAAHVEREPLLSLLWGNLHKYSNKVQRKENYINLLK